MRTVVIGMLLTLTSGALSLPPSEHRTRFSRYRSWNSHMYPVWRDGDLRYRDCWTGGEVTFQVRSDSPTLTGAKTTFNIDVQFPQNQTVLPDGQVVWARNCTFNGTQYAMGQTVYPEPSFTQEWTGVFPDGTPFTKISSQKPRFIYVWKTWGRYWQVADGPSSHLTIDTNTEPVGSYSIEVVVYHWRGKDKFIPLGYASAQFSITDQIPFAVTLSQIGDISQGDQSFIQNTAVSFSINLHDPSQYLSGSDITYNWDFGDNSGTLISRDTTVTHTYLSSGSFRPQVLLMAAILSDCTADPSTAAFTVTTAPDTGDLPASSVLPNEGDAVSFVMATEDVTADVNDLALEPASTEAAVNAAADQEVPTVAEAAAMIVTAETVSEAITSVPDEVIINLSATVVPESPAATTDVVEILAPAGTEAAVNAAADQEVPTVAEAAAMIITAETVSEANTSVPDEVIINLSATRLPESPAAEAAAVMETAAPVDVLNTDVATSVISASEETEIVSEATTETIEDTSSSVSEVTVRDVTASGLETVTQATLVIAKRQAPEMTAEACMIYRYGSFSTTIDVVQGIESVEIVEVNNAVTTESEQNAVDLTITCQGSLPNQVCTVISDADCVNPVQTLCNAVTPTSECQMVLRQFFNDSGTFCINVSLTNDVSLAVTSAKVSVTVGTSSSRGTAGAALGLLLSICVVGAIAFTYKRLKHYHPVRADYRNRNSVSLMLWNFVSRQTAGESRPLLHRQAV